MQKRKKGFTLAELCVVMAVLVIVVGLIVTFTTLISNRTVATRERGEVIDDISGLEVMIQSWIRHYDNVDYKFQVTSDKTRLQAVAQENTAHAGETFSIYLSEDRTKLICDGFSAWHARSSLTRVKFDIAPSTELGSSSGKYIIYCDVTYLDPASDSEVSSRLIFTTHAGATLKL